MTGPSALPPGMVGLLPLLLVILLGLLPQHVAAQSCDGTGNWVGGGVPLYNCGGPQVTLYGLNGKIAAKAIDVTDIPVPLHCGLMWV